MRFALTIFLAAFLLFLVQLVMGKLVLPWFGGAPAVWTTCMLFFQVGLLLGYAWAHGLAARFEPRRQAVVHGAFLVVAAGILVSGWFRWGTPLLASDAWKPAPDEAPVPAILGLLGATVGVPYVALAATSPLLQRWHSYQARPAPGERAASTYRLYAFSNVGSLLALLTYPFVVEPLASLPAQATAWALGFIVFMAGVFACGLALPRRGRMPAPGGEASGTAGAAVDPGASTPGLAAPAPEADGDGRLPLWRVSLWVLLALAASAMFLAVTNELCQEVAAVPFLWVVPLSVYLVSFIICFDRPAWYRRGLWLGIASILTVVVLVAAFLGVRMKIPAHIVIGSTFLLAFCIVCHGELFRARPGARHLTAFYLSVAAGGALGGLFAGVVAPLWFRGFWEFHIALTLAWVLLAAVWWRDPTSPFHAGNRWLFAVLVAIAVYVVVRVTVTLAFPLRAAAPWLDSLPLAIAVGIAVALAALWFGRRRAFPRSGIWPRVLVGLVIFLAECFMLVRIRSIAANSLDADRNFFGTVEVQAFPPSPSGTPGYLQLTHGRINHGLQIMDPEWRHRPVSYYGVGTGIHLAATCHPRRTTDQPLPMRIGVLGLGVGTMAAFAEAGDTVRFYEINPIVIGYSFGERPFFTYVADCPGEVELARGDARLALERELASANPGSFDLLVMDAFSSDSVPVHLLTREAIALYAAHLRDDDSVIAVNISNRFLDLRDLVVTLGEEAGFQARLFVAGYAGIERTGSMWILLTRSGRLFEDAGVAEHAIAWEPEQPVVWTDRFSSLFPLLR